MIKYKYFVLLYMLQDVILERKKKTKKIDLSRLEVATKSKSRLQQVWRGRSGRIREKSRLSKPTHGWSSCGNTRPIHVVNPIHWWMHSNLVQISDVSLAVMCTSWSHLTASCSSAWASWFFWSHAHTALGSLAGLSIQPSVTLRSCLHMSIASINIFQIL